MTTPPSHDDDAHLTPADRAAMGQSPPAVRVTAPRPVTGTPPSASSPGPTAGSGSDAPSASEPGASPAGPGTPGAGTGGAGTGGSGATGTGATEAGAPGGPATPSGAGTPSAPGTGTWTATGNGTSTAPRPTTSSAPTGQDRARHADDAAAADKDVLPEPPSKPGAARHLLGLLLGLVLTPAGLLLTAIGTARLAEVAGTSDMGTDALGAIMLGVGLAILAVLVLLGAWTPAVPLTGGLVWGVGLGTAYLVVPGVMEDAVESVFGDTPAAAEELGEAAMSGHLLAVGVLIVAGGLAAAIARRAGRRWAEGVAAAEAARTRSIAGQRDRIRIEADRRSRQGH